jgi:N4-gp56 family major capsid protein
MANTSIATSHGLTVEQWNAQLFKIYQEGTFFGRFKGVDNKSVVRVQRDLQKAPGDAVTFGFSNSIRGTAGVTGNTPLEGTIGTGSDAAYQSNSEAMTYNYQRVVIDQVRQQIKIVGKMDEKRVAFSMRNDARSQLTDWLSYDEDQAIFTALNACDLVLSAHITGTGLTYDAIVDMKKEAMFPTFGNIDATEGSEKTTRKIEPIKVEGGEEYFILGVNPSDAAAFRKSTDFKTFNQNAGLRGSSNAIFTGSLGTFNNVVIHEHSSFAAGTPVLMGANAVLLAYGQEIMYGEDMFDYDNQVGFMIGQIRGVALAKHDGTTDNASGSSYGAIRFNIAS